MHKKLAVLLTAAISFTSYATEITPEFTKQVFLNLDVTSFRSSMGPMHYHKGTTMQQTFKPKDNHQIKPCNSEGNKNCIEIFFPNPDETGPYPESPFGWSYMLKIISVNKKEITACFSDFCYGSCAYGAQYPVKIKKKHGKYVVIKDYDESINGCTFYLK